MASFNKVILLGNLTRDPELRATPKGTSVCQIGIAVNSTFTDREGNKKEETTFVDVDVYGRSAETIAKYCAKGRPLLVEGRLKLDSWETKEGEKRNKLKVVLESFQFVGSAKDSAGSRDGAGDQREYRAPAARSSASAPVGTLTSRAENVDEEDVPF